MSEHDKSPRQNNGAHSSRGANNNGLNDRTQRGLNGHTNGLLGSRQPDDNLRSQFGNMGFEDARTAARSAQDIFPDGFPTGPDPVPRSGGSAPAADAPRTIYRPKLDIGKSNITPFDGTPSRLLPFLYDL